MFVTYDPEADGGYIGLKDIGRGEAVRQQIVRIKNGELILDFDRNDVLIGIEILGAGAVLPTQLLESARRHR